MEGSERRQRPPSKKPCRFYHMNDCYRGDKCHMLHVPKEELPPCQTHQFWLEDPWSRPPCEWGNARCPHPHPDPTGPSEPELLRANIALQTENSQLARVRGYVGDVLGGGGAASDVGIGRSGTSRYKQKLVLMDAKDPEDFSRRCVADPTLCRSLLRVYILGGGVCTSLEDVGKMVSEDVRAGKFRSAPVTETGPGDAAAREPLRVRVQALPKVMEVQLIDEESSFWENHFPNLVRERQAGIFTHVLSIVFVRGAFLYGVAEAATHGQSIIRNNDEDSPICRAFYKIKEVTARAGIVYDKKWTAIDIGASPGGWTSFLAPKCRRVISVDPAELDPAVLALPNVAHVRQLVEGARGKILELLVGAWPASNGDGTGSQHSPDRARDSNGRGPVASFGAVDRRSLLASGDISGEAEEQGSQRVGVPETGESTSSLDVPQRKQVQGEEVSARPEVTSAVSDASPSTSAVAADLLVTDMNAEPEVIGKVLLSSMVAGLAKPGALVVATFKDFCGRQKRMRDEVRIALARLEAGSGADDSWSRGLGAICMDKDTGGKNGIIDPSLESIPMDRYPQTDAECSSVDARYNWRLEGIQTMKLLAGGQAEVTACARVVRDRASTDDGIDQSPLPAEQDEQGVSASVKLVAMNV